MSENKDFVTELDERLETHAEDIQRIRGSLKNGEQGDNHIQAVQELFDLDTKV